MSLVPTWLEAEVDLAIDEGFTGKALDYEIERRSRRHRRRARARDTHYGPRPAADPWPHP